MNNAERFLNCYNEIDKFLKNANNDNFESYSSKIRGSTNSVIKNHKDKLMDYGDLRNAIVHNPKISGKYIAEPLEEVTNDIQTILEKLKNPKKVIPLFQFEVLGAKQDEKLDGILKLMRENSFSQFPVFSESGDVIELISTNTISRWLAENIVNDEIITENPKIYDLLKSIEFTKNYMFISRDCDIYTAYNYFINQIEINKRNLDAIFITNSGKQNEKLLGLITIEDIASKV